MPGLPSSSRTRRLPLTGNSAHEYLTWSAATLAIAVFNGCTINQLHAGNAAFLCRENGFLENTQLLVLALAIALFGFSGLKGRGAVRVAGVLLALVGSIAFVREADLKSLMAGSAGLDRLLAYQLEDAVLGLLGAVAGLYLLLQWRYFRGLVRLSLRWQAWPCFAACLLLAAAHYLDGVAYSSAPFWEELIETNAYFLFAMAAWRHAVLIGDRKFDLPVLRPPTAGASRASAALSAVLTRVRSSVQPIFLAYHSAFEGVFA